MKYTVKDVKEAIPAIKIKKDPLWGKWTMKRDISCFFVPICLNMGFTPNMVSVISIINALLAAVFMSINNLACVIIGFFLLDFFGILDSIDGNMARILKKASYMGEFYDAIGGYSVDAFSLIGVGMCAYNFGRVLLVKDLFILFVASSVGTTCHLFARLIYQKYTANELISNYKLGKPLVRENDSFYENKHKINISYIRMRVDREFGTAGFFAPIVVLGFIFKLLDVVILAYTLYYIVALLCVFVIYCKKASDFDKNERASKDL